MRVESHAANRIHPAFWEYFEVADRPVGAVQ
jgi:hypothetical protein